MTDSIISKIETAEHACRLHCFPNIPLDDTSGGNYCMAGTYGFKRSDFKNSDGVCPESPEPDLSNDEDPNAADEGQLELAIDAAKKQAYQKGFCEGQQAGLKSASKELEPALKSLQQAAVQLQNVRKEIYREIEKEVVELALAVARKVVCQELKTSRDVVLAVTQKALEMVEVPGEIIVKLNPADLRYIEQHEHRIANLFSDFDRLTFKAQDSVSSGSCMVETKLGEIDARIERQLQRVEEAFGIGLTK